MLCWALWLLFGVEGVPVTLCILFKRYHKAATWKTNSHGFKVSVCWESTFCSHREGRGGLPWCVWTGHLSSESNGHPGTSGLVYVPVISIMTLDCHLSAYFHVLFLATIRAVIGEQFQGVSALIKYVDPGNSEGYLATPHISAHRNVHGGWHKYSLLCYCLWLSSPLRRLENKGLQRAGVVKTAVLQRVPTSTRESFVFLNKCFLDVTLKSHLRFLLLPSTSVAFLLFILPFEASMNLKETCMVGISWQRAAYCAFLASDVSEWHSDSHGRATADQ